MGSETLLLTLGILVSLLVALVTGIILLVVRRKTIGKLLNPKRFLKSPTGLGKTGWSLFYLTVLSFIVAHAIGFLVTDPTAPGPISKIVSGGGLKTYIYAITTFGIVIPILEELAFRGLFLYSLASLFNKNVAIALTVIVFAVGHAYSLGYILAILPTSIIFTLITTSTGSLVPSTLIHIGHNVSAVMLVIFFI